MYYELYLDSFFLKNFMLDYLLLLLTGKLLQCTATHWRIFLGAVFGAGMACVIVLLPYIPVVCYIPAVAKLTLAYAAISSLMVRISFPIKHWKVLLWGTAYLYFFTFCLAGYFHFIRKQNPFFGYIGAFLVIWAIGERKRKRENVYKQAELWIGDAKFPMVGLLDTGNGLVEPISGKPVSIISRSYLEKHGIVFAEENLRLIPFHSIGKGHGYLEGHTVERLVIRDEDGDITVDNAIIGISKEEVSAGGRYDMIISPKYYSAPKGLQK